MFDLDSLFRILFLFGLFQFIQNMARIGFDLILW